jgi:hypothetical protein
MSIDPLVENAVNRVRKELITRTDNITTAIANNTSGVSDLDLVAGENLTVGDPVFLGTDGKAYKTTTFGNISSPITEASSTQYLIDETANKIIAIGFGTSTDQLYINIGAYSTTTGGITWGASTLSTAITSIGSGFSCIKIASNKMVVSRIVSGDYKAMVIDYSGATATFGAAVTATLTNMSAVASYREMISDGAGNFVSIWFRQSSNYNLMGMKGSVSGTTITLGAEVNLNTSFSVASSSFQSIVYADYDSTVSRGVVIFAGDTTGNGTGNRLIITLLNFGGTLTKAYEDSIYNVGNTTYKSFVSSARVIKLNAGDRYFLSYNNGESNPQIIAQLFTVSASSYSSGSPETVGTGNLATSSPTVYIGEDTTNNKLFCSSPGNTSNGYYSSTFTYSGNTLTKTNTPSVNYASQFLAPHAIALQSSVISLISLSGVLPRSVGSISNTLSVPDRGATRDQIILTATSGRSTFQIPRLVDSLGFFANHGGKPTRYNELGVSTQTVSAAATVKVRLKSIKTSPAKIITGLSGLVPGAHYYVDSSGARALAGISYLGYAKSATELILANPSGAEA